MRRGLVLFAFVLALIPMFSLQAASQSNLIELTVWMAPSHSGPEWDSHWVNVKAEFEEKNPGFTIVRSVDGFSFDPSGWIPRVVAGVGPDVGLIRGNFAYAMVEAGILLALDEYIERSPHMAADQFVPASMVYGTHGGATYGFPWSFEAKIMAFDTRHFEEVGLDPRPQTLATWDDLVDSAQLLTQRRGDGTLSRAGLWNINVGSLDRLLEAMFSNGAYYLDDNGMPQFNTPESLEALEFLIGLRQHDIMAPGMTVNEGTASIQIMDTSAIYYRFNQVDPNFSQWLNIAPYPKGPSTDVANYYSWSNLWAIPFNAKYPEQSWSFIEIWMSLEHQVGLFEARKGTNVLSPRLDFFQSDAFYNSLTRLPFFAQMPHVFTNSVPRLFVNSTEIINVAGEQLRMVAGGSMAPATALEEIDRRLMPVFQK